MRLGEKGKQRIRSLLRTYGPLRKIENFSAQAPSRACHGGLVQIEGGEKQKALLPRSRSDVKRRKQTYKEWRTQGKACSGKPEGGGKIKSLSRTLIATSRVGDRIRKNDVFQKKRKEEGKREKTIPIRFYIILSKTRGTSRGNRGDRGLE